MKHFKLFEEFQTSLKSVDKAPERVKGSRGENVVRPPKAVYAKTLSKFGEKVLNFVKSEMKESSLFPIQDNLWLYYYMKSNGKKVFSKGDTKDLEIATSTPSFLKSNEVISRIGSSKDLDYVEIHRLAFKEFNVYKVDAYGLDKYNDYGVRHTLSIRTFWFITAKDARYKDNLKKLNQKFGL
jgi:hypothetical protein